MGNLFFGSKATSGLCQPLIALMPPHATFIESHLGNGRIMQRKPAALRSIGIDLDRRAIKAFERHCPVELVHGCCHAYLAQFDWDGTELVFCDPPYLASARKAPERCRCRCDYEESDPLELLEIVRRLPCAVMICGCSSALYDDALSDWNTLALQVMNQAGVVTERVWFSFTPDRVHWWRCAGKNFTDRQRIKRKAQNWGRRCRALPHAERVAVFARVPDPRRGRNKQYRFDDIVMSAFSCFFIQSPSFLDHQRVFHKANGKSAAGSLFGIARLPTDIHIRAQLDRIDSADLHDGFDLAFEQLQTFSALGPYQALGGRTPIALDGSEFQTRARSTASTARPASRTKARTPSTPNTVTACWRRSWSGSATRMRCRCARNSSPRRTATPSRTARPRPPAAGWTATPRAMPASGRSVSAMTSTPKSRCAERSWRPAPTSSCA